MKKRLAREIAPVLSTLLLMAAGGLLPREGIRDWRLVLPLALCAVLPLLLELCGFVAFELVNRRLRQADIAKMQRYLVGHRDAAAETARAKLASLRRLRMLTGAYTALLWLLAAGTALLAGLTFQEAFSLLTLPVCFWAYLLFYAVYSRFRREQTDDPTGDGVVPLDEADYPALYAAARRAADSLEYRGRIGILLTPGCNASVLREPQGCRLLLGAMLLQIMSEEELHCILLHELAHIAAAQPETLREARCNARIHEWESDSTWQLHAVRGLFLPLDFAYTFHYGLYEYASSVINELAADRAMADFGSPAAAVSGLLRLFYTDRYEWEDGLEDRTSLLEPEEPAPDYIARNLDAFRQAVERRHKDWDAMVGIEILANNASHPTLRMRMEALGVSEARTIPQNDSAAWTAEMQKALAAAEQAVLKVRKETYAKDREENYLTPLREVTEWEEKGRPVTSGYPDIVAALDQLCRYSEAEELCERAMAELPDTSSLYARYFKGCCMLYRYDARGMELIYHAIEKNSNLLENGLSVIGTFCCYTGREQELQDYRRRAVQLSQKDKDSTSQAGFLTRHDRLSSETLPEGMLENILAYIGSVADGKIARVYLVRKTVSDSFFTSVFLIRFAGGTDQQQREILHKIFLYLDGYPVEWQFSLFDYADYAFIHPEKINGSLVWSNTPKEKTLEGPAS